MQSLSARIVLLWLALAHAALAANASLAADPSPSPNGPLVLDEGCYFRHYYQLDWDVLSPGPLKTDFEKYFGKAQLLRLQSQVKQRLKHLKLDWDTTDWRDKAVVRFVCPNAGIQPAPEAERFMNSPPAPADWTQPGFDDSSWQRQRKPFLVGRPSVGFGVQNCGVRAACFRTRFFVPDPAKAGTLTLRVVYRGGVRVWLNGQEIGRGSLPPGSLGPDSVAEDYPLEAYVRTMAELQSAAQADKGESAQKFLAAVKAEVEKSGVYPPPKHIYHLYVAELFGPFDEAQKTPGYPDMALAWGIEGAGTGKWSYRRDVWDRIRALRERVLGPITVPAEALRPGENVLAIETRAARFHPIVCGDWFGGGNLSWPHAQISYIELRATGAVPSVLQRPENMQVWVEDPQHQVHDTEWGDRSAKPATVRFVGAPGGTYGGQIVVGSDRDLTDLAAVPSDLKSAGGWGRAERLRNGEATGETHRSEGKATLAELVPISQPRSGAPAVPRAKGDHGAVIPAAALSAVPMKPIPLTALSSTIGGRSKTASDPMVGANISLLRHAPVNAHRLSPEEKRKLMDRINIYDQIGADGPRSVPADRCHPLWLSLKIPYGTPPGVYRGTIAVSAGGKSATVSTEAVVTGWRLPEPRDFQTLMALEFSPYAVARQYQVPLWSDEHLKLLVPTLQQLARVGNGFVFVPVVSWTEFGNRDDSCVRWTRRKDGMLTWDYSRLDRFLDLCARHMGQLRCVTFVVMNGNPSNPGEVMVEDEATGRREVLLLQGEKISVSDRRTIWGSFAVDLYNHMKARGQEKAMYWGYAWDTEGDPMLKNLLAEVTPGVHWAMGGHDIRVDPRFYKVTSWIYKVYGAMSLVENRQGWKNPDLEFQNPRGGGSVLCLPGPFPSFAYRLTVDRALTVGCRGVARVGVDYWKDTYYDGARGGEVWCQPGMPVHAVFWPGEKGAESSSRFEAMAEAVQEAEARIFIEQTVDRRLLPAALAPKAQQVVFDHLAATSFIPAGVAAERTIEYGATGWQERSLRLYQMAAEIADFLKLDTAETAMAVDVAPRSKQRISLRIRNWGDKERAMSVSADVPWIVAEKPQAPAPPGFSSLGLTLDGHTLEPGKVSQGTLTLTDTGTDRSFAVAVTARVSPVLNVSTNRMVFNVTAGKAESREFSLLNSSGEEISWKAAADAPWLSILPAEGKLAPASARIVTVTAQPTADAAECNIGISSPDAAESAIAVRAFCIAPYVPADLPAGEPVPVETLDLKKFLKRHQMLAATQEKMEQNYFRTEPRYKTPQFGEGYFGPHVYLKDVAKTHAKTFKTAMWIKPRGEIAFSLADAGFTAFSAEVGIPPGIMEDAVMNFEIHVDGKLRTQSNLMTVRDAPRRLVVTGLQKASEILLVTRLANLRDDDRVTAFWADPKFYR